MTPLEALQDTLAGEHAAVYVFAVLGAQTSRSSDPQLYSAVDGAHTIHRRQRDRLRELVRAAGSVPVSAAASYELPNAVAGAAQVAAAARLVEARCADLYGQLVENSTGATRAWAIAALGLSAVRALAVGANPEPFPGLTSR